MKLEEKIIGKTISYMKLEDDVLSIGFSDNTRIQIYDDGQSCCEARYITTEDNLDYFIGANLVKIEERKAAPIEESEYGDVHEIVFVDITTTHGVVQLCSHNEHNGYYGGFDLVVKELE